MEHFETERKYEHKLRVTKGLAYKFGYFIFK